MASAPAAGAGGGEASAARTGTPASPDRLRCSDTSQPSTPCSRQEMPAPCGRRPPSVVTAEAKRKCPGKVSRAVTSCCGRATVTLTRSVPTPASARACHASAASVAMRLAVVAGTASASAASRTKLRTTSPCPGARVRCSSQGLAVGGLGMGGGFLTFMSWFRQLRHFITPEIGPAGQSGQSLEADEQHLR